MQPFSKLSLFIAASVLVHAGVVFWLTYTSNQLAPAVKGVVDVDFIQPISHATEAAAHRHTSPRMAPPRAAQPDEKATEPAEQKPASSFAGDPAAIALATDAFLQNVARLIDRNKVYPRESLRREEEGKVVIGVSLNRDGSVADVKLEQPCPFSALNEAALKTVAAIGRFPEVPLEIPVPLHVHVPLSFRLQRP
ncbi:MAG: energy transducer TonB [Bdellovibrionales bacterium]|nr:energy transducer TonB [Bdellovibrionales bacterium]